MYSSTSLKTPELPPSILASHTVLNQVFDTDDVLDTSEIKSPRWCGGQVVQTLVAGTERWSNFRPPKIFLPDYSSRVVMASAKISLSIYMR